MGEGAVVARLIPKVDYNNLSAAEIKGILPDGQAIEQVKDKIDFESKVDVPFTAHEKLKGEPFSVGYFGIKDWGIYKEEPKLDVKKLVEKVGLIEEFMSKEIKRAHLKDSTKSYLQLIKEIEEEIGATEQELPLYKLKRIANYIKALNKQRDKHGV